jgi:hypothetical protein
MNLSNTKSQIATSNSVEMARFKRFNFLITSVILEQYCKNFVKNEYFAIVQETTNVFKI